MIKENTACHVGGPEQAAATATPAMLVLYLDVKACMCCCVNILCAACVYIYWD